LRSTHGSQTSAFTIRSASPLSAPCWRSFNLRLDRETADPFNEASLEKWLQEMAGQGRHHTDLYWLSLARITELALLLAGTYADACEFEAAGDLLVTPRRLELFVKGHHGAMIKPRHASISSCFTLLSGGSHPGAACLAAETMARVRRPALLPHLEQEMKNSGAFTASHLGSIHRRMCRVADAIAFLMAWQVTDLGELHHRLGQSDGSTRRFVSRHLCRFTRDRFEKLGSEIGRRAQEPGCRDSAFLLSPVP